MKYLTALPVFVLLFVLDLLILIAHVCTLTFMDIPREYPYSEGFAKGIWT